MLLLINYACHGMIENYVQIIGIMKNHVAVSATVLILGQ